MGLAKRREELRGEALRRAGEVAAKIRGTALLVGSFARGDFSEDSDVDLLVVGDFREPPHRRLLDVWAPGVEIIALTPEEALKVVERCYPLAHDVALGIVLKDDLGLAERLISLARRCAEKTGISRS